MQHNTLKVMETKNQKPCIQTNFESNSYCTGSDDDENQVLPW